MKKIALFFGIMFAFLAIAPSALAYGGGGGFPPGYFDNVHAS